MSAPRPIGDGLWDLEREARMLGGVRLPVRATLVRLPDGGLLAHSPIRLDPGVGEAVAALGPVRHLVAPNRFHHLGLADWKARFPEALLWGPPGLAAKRKDLAFAGILDGGAPSPSPSPSPPWAATLRPLALAGCAPLGEVVFLHAASRSLLCSDLLFNIRHPANRATRFVLTLMGTNGRFAMSRLMRRYTKDRRALAASLEQMLAWDFARVIPGHGEIFEAEGGDAAPAVRAALAWALRP